MLLYYATPIDHATPSDKDVIRDTVEKMHNTLPSGWSVFCPSLAWHGTIGDAEAICRSNLFVLEQCDAMAILLPRDSITIGCFTEAALFNASNPEAPILISDATGRCRNSLVVASWKGVNIYDPHSPNNKDHWTAWLAAELERHVTSNSPF